MRASALALVLIFTSLVAGAPKAATFTTAGLTFSDELGGFRLVSVSGTGTVLDPIVIIEEISEVGSAVLVIRGTQQRPRSGTEGAIRPPSSVSLAVIKIVINASARPWAGFDLELREALGKPSPYGDGLSFDQLESFRSPIISNRFSSGLRVDEPFDRVSFREGSIDAGGTGRFNFFITDPTPVSEFFLLQEPLLLIAWEGAPDRQPVHGFPIRPVRLFSGLNSGDTWRIGFMNKVNKKGDPE